MAIATCIYLVDSHFRFLADCIFIQRAHHPTFSYKRTATEYTEGSEAIYIQKSIAELYK
jgi:hypothetical protein